MPISMPPPRIAAEYRVSEVGDLERLAGGFAALPAADADAQLDALATQAIARWRLDDATAWQRVKFRARLIRAAQRNDPEAAEPMGKN